jgi:hypothetical protein
MKHSPHLIVVTFLLALAAGYGFYRYAYRTHPPRPVPLHPIIENDKHRLTVIAHTWDTVDKEIQSKSEYDYVSANRLTEAGRAYIKKRVREVVAQQAGKALETDPNLQLLERLITISMIASYSFLKWCPCMLADKRIDLAFTVVHDIMNHFPDRTQHLTYVSLGSGDLLQDFVIIAELIHEGYCALELIGIDLKYKHIRHITITNGHKRVSKGTNSSKEAAEVAHMIGAFKSSVAELLQTKSALDCTVELYPYISAYAYIEAVKAGLEDKAQVLVMADPTRFLPYLEVNSMGEANCLEFVDNGLLLCMPEFQKPKGYLPIDSAKKFLEDDLNQIRDIISSTSHHSYRGSLKSGLLTYTREAKRKLRYYADPYITFQDLIRHTQAGHSLAFGLFEKPGTSEALVHKLDGAKYSDEDVVTPHLGKDLTTKDRPTKLYKELVL